MRNLRLYSAVACFCLAGGFATAQQATQESTRYPKPVLSEVLPETEERTTAADSIFIIDYADLQSRIVSQPGTATASRIRISLLTSEADESALPGHAVDSRKFIFSPVLNRSVGVAFNPFINKDSILFSIPRRYRIKDVLMRVWHSNKTNLDDTLRLVFRSLLPQSEPTANGEITYYYPDTTAEGLLATYDQKYRTSLTGGRNLLNTNVAARSVSIKVDKVIDDEFLNGFGCFVEFYAPEIERQIGGVPILVTDSLCVQTFMFPRRKRGNINEFWWDGTQGPEPDSIARNTFFNTYTTDQNGDFINQNLFTYNQQATQFPGQPVLTQFNDMRVEVDLTAAGSQQPTSRALENVFTIGNLRPSNVQQGQQFVVPFENKNYEDVSLSLVNQLGQTIRSYSYPSLFPGKHEIRLTSDLNPGVYFVTLQSKTGLKTQRLVVTH
jgi:hypothetical protein